MPELNTSLPQSDKSEIVKETAKIAWSELLRFFASGHAIFVDQSLDLVDVASTCRKDDAETLKNWMDRAVIHPVNDEQAKSWLEDDVIVWAVVVAPWVLVQTVAEEH